MITGPCEPVTLDIQLSCFMRRYRTFDGSCNNLCNVTRGSALRPFSRLLPSAYQDGKHAPRSLGSNNQPLPNARNVSKIVFVSSTSNDDNTTTNFTHVTMTWGQFLDHDITLTQQNETVECGNNSLPCRGPEEGCIGIDILQGNELRDNRSALCMPLRRSAIKNGEQVSHWPSLSWSRWLDINWPRSFCIDVDKHAKKSRGLYPTILTEQAWSANKEFMIWHTEQISLRIQRAIPSAQDVTCWSSQSQRRI